MSTRKENYKSDIRLSLTLTLGGVAISVPQHDFALKFFTTGNRSYMCSHIGGAWTNCKEEDGKVICYLDNHQLPPGELRVKYYDYAPNAEFADGNQLKVVPRNLDIELVSGAGDDAEEISATVVTELNTLLADVRQAAADAIAAASQIPEMPDLSSYYTKSETNSLLSGKQSTLTFDDAPTSSSDNPVKSGGVYTALSGKQDTIDDLSGIRSGAGAGATAYQKPSGGIPDTDLSSAVQTSLGKADTALQSFTETDPTVPSWAKASSKPSYAYSEISGTPTLATVATSGSYNDLSNKPTIPSAVTVVDNLASTSTTSALSANQGKALYDMIGDVETLLASI